MVHYSSFNEKELKVISNVRNYLLESGQQACVNAFDKAITEVLSYNKTGYNSSNFSKKVNSLLCEALMIANYDSKCNNKYKKLICSLIESYRSAYGLPNDDFEYIEY